jgi:hypothetical protein
MEKIAIITLKLNKNKISYIPTFEINKSIKQLIFEAEENLIENIDLFAKQFKNLEKLEKLDLKVNKNKLTSIP